MVCPDARQEIRLELEPNRQLVAFFLAHLALGSVHLLADAEQVLNVMSDFVSNDVGLGELAGGLEFVRELFEEAQVDVDLRVGRAIERARRPRWPFRKPSRPGARKVTSLGFWYCLPFLRKTSVQTSSVSASTTLTKSTRSSSSAGLRARQLIGACRLVLLLLLKRIEHLAGISTQEDCGQRQQKCSDSAADRDSGGCQSALDPRRSRSDVLPSNA